MRVEDCIACQAGNHDGHDGSVRGALSGGCSHTPAVGGSLCICKGDCAERFKAHLEEVSSFMRDGTLDDVVDYVTRRRAELTKGTTTDEEDGR